MNTTGTLPLTATHLAQALEQRQFVLHYQLLSGLRNRVNLRGITRFCGS